MKILFLVPYPTEGASNRVRVEQFLPYLKAKGVSYKVRPFVSRPFYGILYLPGRCAEKFLHFIICTLSRIADIFRAITYDVIFIHREAFPFGGPFIESILHRMGKPIIYDFDDAIFLPSTSRHNIYINKFKNPNKISSIIRKSSRVIAGNNYLKDFALQFNKNSIMIPSSVDTENYIPVERNPKDNIVIGWIGSNTTEEFLYDLEDVFVKLSGKYKNLVFKIVGAEFKTVALSNVVSKKWRLEEEILDLQSFDIGIMPMPDNLWTKGKCGFKAILYMACGIPVVISKVGMNAEIIDEGVDGFFAQSPEEWIEKLSLLINDVSLRRTMGHKGREKVIAQYSLSVNAPLFNKTIVAACGENLFSGNKSGKVDNQV